MARVLRVLVAASLLAVVAAGCGAAARPQTSAVDRVPPALAEKWEGQASAIATAASTNQSCKALRLAQSLRTDVMANEGQVPLRLRSPLLSAVNSLARRITCTPVVTPQPPPKKSPPPAKGPKPKPPKHHGRHGHGKGPDE